MHISFTVLTTVFMFICLVAVGVDPWLSWLCIPMFLYLSLQLTALLFKNEEKEYYLAGGIPPEKKTACVIYTVFDELTESIGMAEGIYAQNRDENLCFILLCDGGESCEYWSLSDEDKCRDTTAKLKELNARYGDRFYIYVSKREYCSKRKKYIGCGFDKSLFHLVKYIKNREERYSFVHANSHFVHRIKYLVTVDPTCEVEAGAIPRLVGYMSLAHIRPKITDSEVVSGYGVLAQTSKEYIGYGVINTDVYDLLIDDPDLSYVNDELKVFNIGYDYIIRSKYDMKMTCLKRDIKALKNIFQHG